MVVSSDTRIDTDSSAEKGNQRAYLVFAIACVQDICVDTCDASERVNE